MKVAWWLARANLEIIVIRSAKLLASKGASSFPFTARSIKGCRCRYSFWLSVWILAAIAITSVSSDTVPRLRCHRSILLIRPMNDWVFWKNLSGGWERMSKSTFSASLSTGDILRLVSWLSSSSLRNRPSPPADTARASRSRIQTTIRFSK